MRFPRQFQVGAVSVHRCPHSVLRLATLGILIRTGVTTPRRLMLYAKAQGVPEIITNTVAVL